MSVDTPVARECRFAVHLPSPHPNAPDLHFVKERLHYADGRTEPAIRYIENYQRSFYITKPAARNHTEKKETEHLDNLLHYQCTQSQLRHRLATALDKGWSRESVRELSASPYVYGTDLSSTTSIKEAYRTKYPTTRSAYSVAVLDTETDVVMDTKTVILCSVVFENQIFLAVRKDIYAGFSDPAAQIRRKIDHYLSEYVARLDLQITIQLTDTAYDTVAACILQTHQWKPDFLAIWNMDFDVPKMMEMCQLAGVDPKDLFSDPSVPPDRRHFKYKQGQKKTVTASGKVKPIPPSSQWHSVDCPASFYIVDAMCTYRLLRIGKQEEPSYALDAILQRELKITKLKFKEADQYEKLRWHQFMQTHYKLEYAVYNIFDSLSILELDAKTLDLRFTLPAYAGATDFANFRSQPKRITDALYYYLLKKGYVLAAMGGSYQARADGAAEAECDADASDEPSDSFDDDDAEAEDMETLDLRNWISTLSAMMLADNGLQCILEDPTLRTNLRAYVFDSDVCSAYPNDILVANVSKETTWREIIDIEGVDETLFRLQNINALSGPVNALEYCTALFQFPTPDQLLTAYHAEQKKE